MKFQRLRIHLLTAIILQIELGVLIWANVRQRNHPHSPLELPFVDYGWPLDACAITSGKYAGNPYAPRWDLFAVSINSAVAFAILIVTWLVCERLFKETTAEDAA